MVFPRILNAMFGMKFRVVAGYEGVNMVSLAMERGEVEGIVRPWAVTKTVRPEWLRDSKINMIVQYALARHHEIAGVPAYASLAVASGTVHEFNNLLTVMIGLAGLVQSSLPHEHQAQGDLDRLMEAGEQASHLAGQLLAFSKQSKPVPHGVDCQIVRHAKKPCRRILRRARVGPRLERAQHGFLHGLFRQIELRRAENARQVRHDSPRFAPEQVLDQLPLCGRLAHVPKTCLTSIVPPYSRCGWSIARATASL